MKLVQIAQELCNDVSQLSFALPVTHVYNPLEYAWSQHCEYLERYGAGHPQVVLVGMNPGPFGMAQTGIPFGDVAMVRDWMRIKGPVNKPKQEHRRRPIAGLDCHRQEVSGRRLWGWARSAFGTPQHFFSHFFVINYCPLCFLEASGRNRTPDKLPAAERAALFAPCDQALRRTVEHLGPQFVVGIGRFAARRVDTVTGDMAVTRGSVPHPSPANPIANKGWGQALAAALRAIGVEFI